MRVLITGALGFIGSHLADAYLARGDDVVGIDDLSGNVLDTVDGMDLRVQDVRALKHHKYDRADLVVHAASPVGAVALLERPSIVAEIVETTQAVLAYCRRWGAPLVNISSSEVYGFSGVYHEQDDCVIPHRLTHRIQYAAGKLAAEHLVRTSGVSSITVRPFNVAGPRQVSSKGFVIPTFCEQALAGEPLTVFESGDQERSFTGVWDVCRFITCHATPLARQPPKPGFVVNVGNPDNRTTIVGLAERVNRLLGSHAGYRLTDGKSVHGMDYEEARGHVKVPNIHTARMLGWEPSTGLGDLIVKTADEIRQGVTVSG